jgi:hypothetical protein
MTFFQFAAKSFVCYWLQLDEVQPLINGLEVAAVACKTSFNQGSSA